MPLRTLNKLRRTVLGRRIGLWYHPAYRLPFAGIESHLGMEPRRADFAVWYLVDRRVVPTSAVNTSRAVTYEELALVHTPRWLEALSTPEALSEVFSLHPSEIEVDEVMHSIRLATGGTVEAARWAVRTNRPALNLFGGFHHASPDQGAGFCAVNDIAVAVASLRHSGWRGTVAIIDLDAHPPDGLSACFRDDPTVWIASLSGSDWGSLPGVDETLLPAGTGDDAYLAALEKMLSRMPRADLTFVIAGGDVLEGDRFGVLGLTLDGARRRDLRVAQAVEGIGSVWVPGGGYSGDSWRVLAGTGVAMALRTRHAISRHYDPMRVRFARIASEIGKAELGDDPDDFSVADIESALGLRSGKRRLLDFYTTEGVEHALWHYGVLGQLNRLGYRSLRVNVDEVDQGDRMRVFGSFAGTEYLLIECVLERRRIAGRSVVFIHWLTLRHPRAGFEAGKPRLPGQEVPGLGMAREASELLLRMAERLDLDGIAFRPSWYHMAYAGHSRFQFVDAARQGRFEAMQRDFKDISLRKATMAVADGRVLLNGEPYTWEADEMLSLGKGQALNDPAEVAKERDRVRFSLD